MFITGDSSTLASDPHLSSLLDYMFASCHVQSAREYGHLAELNIRSGLVVAAPAPRSRMTDEEDAAFKQATQTKMQAYLATHAVWQASTKLNSHERRLVHILCEELELHHASVDVKVRADTKRQLVVAKTQADLDQFVASLAPKPEPSETAVSLAAATPAATDLPSDHVADASVAAAASAVAADVENGIADNGDNTADNGDSAADDEVLPTASPTTSPIAIQETVSETETQRVLRQRAQRLREEQLAQQDRALLPGAGERAATASKPASSGKKKSKGNGKAKSKPAKAGHRLGGSRPLPSAAGGSDLDALVAAIESGADLPTSKPTGVVDAYIRQGWSSVCEKDCSDLI